MRPRELPRKPLLSRRYIMIPIHLVLRYTPVSKNTTSYHLPSPWKKTKPTHLHPPRNHAIHPRSINSPIGRGDHARETQHTARVCILNRAAEAARRQRERDDANEEKLSAEVDWEEAALEGCEEGAGESAVG